jgi:hypothetical protein
MLGVPQPHTKKLNGFSNRQNSLFITSLPPYPAFRKTSLAALSPLRQIKTAASVIWMLLF